jgi:hypothetical protein
LLVDHLDGVVSIGANGNVGLTFMRGGALNGGDGLASNGIIGLLVVADDDGN